MGDMGVVGRHLIVARTEIGFCLAMVFRGLVMILRSELVMDVVWIQVVGA